MQTSAEEMTFRQCTRTSMHAQSTRFARCAVRALSFDSDPGRSRSRHIIRGTCHSYLSSFWLRNKNHDTSLQNINKHWRHTFFCHVLLSSRIAGGRGKTNWGFCHQIKNQRRQTTLKIQAMRNIFNLTANKLLAHFKLLKMADFIAAFLNKFYLNNVLNKWNSDFCRVQFISLFLSLYLRQTENKFPAPIKIKLFPLKTQINT